MSWNRVHMVLKHDGTKAWCVIITHPSQIIWQQATQIQSTPPQSLSQNCWCLKLLAYIYSQDNTRGTQIVPPGHVKKLSCQPQVNSHDASVLKACGDFQYTCFCWTTDVSFIVYTNRSMYFLLMYVIYLSYSSRPKTNFTSTMMDNKVVLDLYSRSTATTFQLQFNSSAGLVHQYNLFLDLPNYLFNHLIVPTRSSTDLVDSYNYVPGPSLLLIFNHFPSN